MKQQRDSRGWLLSPLSESQWETVRWLLLWGYRPAEIARTYEHIGLTVTTIYNHNSTKWHIPLQPTGRAHLAWKGGQAGYDAIHRRLGRAAEHACTECGAQAANWAYDHSDPNELTAPNGLRYSTDPTRYRPMCLPCHSRFDRHRDGRRCRCQKAGA